MGPGVEQTEQQRSTRTIQRRNEKAFAQAFHKGDRSRPLNTGMRRYLKKRYPDVYPESWHKGGKNGDWEDPLKKMDRGKPEGKKGAAASGSSMAGGVKNPEKATLSKTSGAARQRRKKEREALAAAKKQPGILSTTSGAARRRRQRKREAVAAAVGKSKQGTASRSSPANGGLAPGDEASGSAAQASPKGPEAEDGEWMDETSDDPAEKEGKKEKKGRYSVGEDKGSKAVTVPSTASEQISSAAGQLSPVGVAKHNALASSSSGSGTNKSGGKVYLSKTSDTSTIAAAATAIRKAPTMESSTSGGASHAQASGKVLAAGNGAGKVEAIPPKTKKPRNRPPRAVRLGFIPYVAPNQVQQFNKPSASTETHSGPTCALIDPGIPAGLQMAPTSLEVRAGPIAMPTELIPVTVDEPHGAMAATGASASVPTAAGPWLNLSAPLGFAAPPKSKKGGNHDRAGEWHDVGSESDVGEPMSEGRTDGQEATDESTIIEEDLIDINNCGCGFPGNGALLCVC